MNTTQLPGSRWFGWLRNKTLRVGVLTAVYLTAVMIFAVLAANRLHFLESFALVRNAVSYAAFALVMLVPVGVFLRRPLELFASSILGWTLFSLAYGAMGFFFGNLHARLRTPFNVWVLGAAAYGVTAVAAWILTMALDARHQPAIASRRRPQ